MYQYPTFQFIYGALRSYYAMAEDIVRGFEKSDVDTYLPELPELVMASYGQSATPAPQGIEQIMAEVMGGQGQGTTPTMAGTNPMPGMGFAPAPGAGTEEQGGGRTG